ncbi:MAG: cytochrome C [Deltaproteobacteria bacterium HGW-Deltaproteobacteria-4]|nr:MAG: cytochrome C [Deltaproteobacteria bacterium HGW-Deltaproteobacteria-4]
MRTRNKWLLALVLVGLLSPQTSRAEETVGGQIEAGVYGQDIGKDSARVNEYSRRDNDGVTGYGIFDFHGVSPTTAVDLSIDVLGNDDPNVEMKFDFERILRVKGDYSAFKHQLGHDRIDYLNAAVPGANLFASNNPGNPVSIDAAGLPAAGTSIWSLGPSPNEALNPNNIPAYIGKDAFGNWYATNLAALPPTIAGQAVTWQQIGRASVYGEDFAKDQVFEITRKEAKANADLTLPFLPNVTFHAGLRNEKREGTEQSIGMSKCTSCHVTGGSREVDENTSEFSAGATGRFGLLTVDYNYKNSEFRENAAAPTRVYDPALSPSPSTNYTADFGTFDNRLLYDYDVYNNEISSLPYDQTPDSKKQSHVLKARMDVTNDTSLIGSLVNSATKSRKQGEVGIWDISDQELKSTYDGYGFRVTSKLTDSLKVLLHGKLEQVETDDSVITFYPMGAASQPNFPVPPTVLLAGITKTYESVESRDVVTLGADAVWRLARKSTLHLGYEFKADDRDSDHYGKTTKQTAKATLKTVLAKGVTFRAGYTYQNIDDPFMHENAAGFIDPATGYPYTITDPAGTTSNILIGTGPLYGTAFYDLRQTDLSNQPENVHEGKLSSTWSPASNFSTTAAIRYRNEWNELDRSEWKQETLSPTLSFWYAPAQKLNLTFAYNYLGQRAESTFCQGWYDG